MEVKFFRAPLDPDEREPKLKFKLTKCMEGYPDIPFKDPYDGILTHLTRIGVSSEVFEEVEGLEVEPWLLPAPEPKYAPLLTVENMVAFIDSDGCREYAKKVFNLIHEKIFPGIPIMLGVDHSLTGGCVRALAEEYGPTDVGLIILDSHFDVVTPTIRCGLIQYDIETNPESPFNPLDPYIRGRLDSYNADSFIHYLVREKVIPPENILVLGVSDYPPPQAFRIRDPRVRRYIEHYTGFEELGVTVLSKDKLRKNWEDVKVFLDKLKTDYFYLSIDIDIGARATLQGARFLDYEGLEMEEIYRLVDMVKRKVEGKLVGLDLMETDVYGAGVGRDKTYEVEAEILRMLLNQ